MNLYGLIGYPLTHSFSKKYFTEKFAREGITDSTYELFELPDLAEFPHLLAAHPNLRGLNVTIPHKKTIMPFLDALDESARKVGAVNVIKLDNQGRTTGYNSDYYGFLLSLRHWLGNLSKPSALVLGNGGACRAVTAALTDLGISYLVVSRQPTAETISYEQINAETIKNHPLIINTTPLGTYPAIETFPPIPYSFLTNHHFLYDLVYNPTETQFMLKGAAAGASTHNGLAMLQLQAEKAWEIWSN
ncbi:MAG: shikimate dehydrogenase [Bacteroidota bacterium]